MGFFGDVGGTIAGAAKSAGDKIGDIEGVKVFGSNDLVKGAVGAKKTQQVAKPKPEPKPKPTTAPVDEETARVQSDATKSLVNWTKAVQGGLASNVGTQIKKKVAVNVASEMGGGSNTMLYVALGAGALVVGGIVISMMR